MKLDVVNDSTAGQQKNYKKLVQYLWARNWSGSKSN